MIRKDPVVSVIINCHNGEAFLKDCILSVKKQTFKNFEVIFWDNASNDRSKLIFFSLKDARFKYFFSKKKISLYKARNLALKKAKGNYITFIDVDDLWIKSKLKKQIQQFKNEKICVVYSNVILKKTNSQKKKLFTQQLPSGKIEKSFFSGPYPTILSSMVKRSFLKTHNIKFNNNYDHIGDFDFFFRLAKKFEFKGINKPLVICRLHKNNLTKIKRINQIKEMKQWIKKNINILDQRSLNIITSKLNYQKFLYHKLRSNYIKSLMYIFFGNYMIKFFLKKILIFFLPNKFLKKFLWY